MIRGHLRPLNHYPEWEIRAVCPIRPLSLSAPNYAPSDKKLGEKTTETTEKDDTRLRCCLSRLFRLSRLSHSLTELKLCVSTRRFSPQAKRLLCFLGPLGP